MKRMLLTVLALTPTAALAHVGDHSLLNLSAGLLHPLNGLDHLLALLATGIWLAQSDTRGKGVFVAGFIAVLALAIPLGMQFTNFTFEGSIVATLVVLGALVAVGVQGSIALRASVVLATAAVHGFVHGTELPVGDGVMPFATGLIASSLMMVALAIVAGACASKTASGLLTRSVGVAVIIVGLVLSV
jgi:urease accessory protein